MAQVELTVINLQCWKNQLDYHGEMYQAWDYSVSGHTAWEEGSSITVWTIGVNSLTAPPRSGWQQSTNKTHSCLIALAISQSHECVDTYKVKEFFGLMKNKADNDFCRQAICGSLLWLIFGTSPHVKYNYTHVNVHVHCVYTTCETRMSKYIIIIHKGVSSGVIHTGV